MRLRSDCVLLLSVIAFFVADAVHACNVPVFRYALERWKPDLYEAILFHEGPLTAELEQLVARVRATDEHGRLLANLRLTTVDVMGDVDDAVLALWKSQSSAMAPWLLVRYPSSLMLDNPMWSGPADRSTVEALLHSPARQELSRRLLAGHSNVWLVIESGDAQQDRQVVETLEGELAKLAATIKLPDESAQPGGVLTLPEDQGEGVLSKVPLGIEFSVVRVSRNDPAERAFLANILQTDEGLAAESGVVVLPVFGRGRALQAFPGLALDGGMITGVEEFLCGACSCSVKAQNPGMDLLLTADWESVLDSDPLDTHLVAEEASEPSEPTLVAIPQGHSQPDPAEADAQVEERQATSRLGDWSHLKMAFAAAVVACVAFGITRVLVKRGG